MKTLWKGAISFGLINVPVSAYTATEHKAHKFNQLHKGCEAPIKYTKICSSCRKEVPMDEIIKGYEFQTGNYVIIHDEELKKATKEDKNTIDIQDFVSLNQVDPIYFEKTYYLEPARGGDKAYALLIQAMEKAGKVAIAKVQIRSKLTLAVLRVLDDLLVMETIFYPDEIRSSASLNHGTNIDKLHDNEVKMAVNLIESLSTEFEPTHYQDEHRQSLSEIIEGKIARHEISAPVQNKATGNIVDLMEALKASIQLAEENRNTSEKQKSPSKRKTRVNI